MSFLDRGTVIASKAVQAATAWRTHGGQPQAQRPATASEMRVGDPPPDILVSTAQDRIGAMLVEALGGTSRIWPAEPPQIHDTARRLGGAAPVAVIDIDQFRDTEAAVDLLIALRQNNPALAVVLLSSNFSRDESSPERSVICDTALRLPVGPRRLHAAVRDARNAVRARRSLRAPVKGLN